MKAQLFAVLTAMAWGFGGYFEKKGLHMGGFPAQVGIVVRTGVALVVLGVASLPGWRGLAGAPVSAWLYLVLGGGVLAGSVGMLSFYTALKSAPLTQVLPIAFTSPLFGALLAVVLGTEPLTPRMLLGMALTMGGIAVLTTG